MTVSAEVAAFRAEWERIEHNGAADEFVGRLLAALEAVPPPDGPWTIEQQGTRAARTVTNGTYRYTLFGEHAPVLAVAMRDALNGVEAGASPTGGSGAAAAPGPVPEG